MKFYVSVVLFLLSLTSSAQVQRDVLQKVYSFDYNQVNLALNELHKSMEISKGLLPRLVQIATRHTAERIRDKAQRLVARHYQQRYAADQTLSSRNPTERQATVARERLAQAWFSKPQMEALTLAMIRDQGFREKNDFRLGLHQWEREAPKVHDLFSEFAANPENQHQVLMERTQKPNERRNTKGYVEARIGIFPPSSERFGLADLLAQEPKSMEQLRQAYWGIQILEGFEMANYHFPRALAKMLSWKLPRRVPKEDRGAYRDLLSQLQLRATEILWNLRYVDTEVSKHIEKVPLKDWPLGGKGKFELLFHLENVTTPEAQNERMPPSSQRQAQLIQNPEEVSRRIQETGSDTAKRLLLLTEIARAPVIGSFRRNVLRERLRPLLLEVVGTLPATRQEVQLVTAALRTATKLGLASKHFESLVAKHINHPLPLHPRQDWRLIENFHNAKYDALQGIMTERESRKKNNPSSSRPGRTKRKLEPSTIRELSRFYPNDFNQTERFELLVASGTTDLEVLRRLVAHLSTPQHQDLQNALKALEDLVLREEMPKSFQQEILDQVQRLKLENQVRDFAPRLAFRLNIAVDPSYFQSAETVREYIEKHPKDKRFQRELLKSISRQGLPVSLDTGELDVKGLRPLVEPLLNEILTSSKSTLADIQLALDTIKALKLIDNPKLLKKATSFASPNPFNRFQRLRHRWRGGNNNVETGRGRARQDSLSLREHYQNLRLRALDILMDVPLLDATHLDYLDKALADENPAIKEKAEELARRHVPADPQSLEIIKAVKPKKGFKNLLHFMHEHCLKK